jgi:NB-ARC domain/TIR domain/Tetratricopeptide repeat
LGGVFINYRTTDSDTVAELIDLELTAQFGEDRVFLDSRSIPAGVDYVEELLGRLRACSVLLVVIGPRWLTVTDAAGQRRIDDPQDWTRREIVEAFNHGLRVIPILTDGVTLPTEADLPDEIVGLSRRQYVQLHRRYTRLDLAHLVKQITEADPELVEAAARDQDNPAPPGRNDSPMTTPVRRPLLVGVLPSPADCYQDRPVLSRRLDAAVGEGGTAVVSQVLSGLGGVGKTQLAADYARRCLSDGQVDLLVWISASSREAILTGYAHAAAEVDPGAADADVPSAAARFVEWLQRTRQRWLVVLDDIVDPGDLRELWPPTRPSGRVLVTTRRRDAAFDGAARVLVKVGLFTEDEALAYLTQKLAAGSDRAGVPEAAELAADLGYLPLALAQAAAYMVDRGLDCPAYRQRFADRRRLLADLLPEPTALPDDHSLTVATTWRLSIELADQLHPEGLARPVITLASLLDPNGIPQEVFTANATLAYLTARTGRDIDADAVTDALHALHRLNLLDFTHPSGDDEAGSVVRVHGLVQRATRDHPTDADTALDTAAQVAADALWEIWPPIATQTAVGVLRANADALHDNAEQALWIPYGHPVLFQAGTSLGETGLVSEAITYYHQLHVTADQFLGPDHPNTLTARHELAYWQGKAGDPAGAAAATEQLLADSMRVLGPDHLITLTARRSHARWRGEAGDPAGAAEELERLLADLMRIFGPDKRITLTARHDLAYWRGKAGDPAGAVEELKRLLDDNLRVLGPDHPDTLTARANLARWRGEAGDPAGAVEELERLLDDNLRVLGPDHPDTLTARGHLARWRGEAGDPAGAVDELKRLLEDNLRVLGPDHPHTLTTRYNLARWRGVAGDPRGAVEELKRLLDDNLRVLGTDHPDTLTARANLARWRGAAGDPAGAVEESERLLADNLRVLGPDHPHTLTTRYNLARWRGVAGDPRGAVEELKRLLADNLRVFGPDHRHTLATRRELDYWQTITDEGQ